LKEKITSTDINQAKADVVNFIVNPQELEIWSNAFWGQLSKMMLFEYTNRIKPRVPRKEAGILLNWIK